MKTGAGIPGDPDQEAHLPALLSSRGRYIRTGLLIGLVLAVLAGALSIPFIFESPSIRYKFGFDKTLLRTGKLVGMAAAVLLLVQLLLSARLKMLDRIFGLLRVYAFHRINGILIALLVLMHPVFILWPEGFTFPPLKLAYWPEGAGILLVVLICFQAAGSLWRRPLKIAYDRWRRYHLYAGVVIILLLILHILFVSETFEEGVPRYALLGAVAGCILIFALAKLKSQPAVRKKYRVDEVVEENSQVVTLALSPKSASGGLRYLPGQFAFLAPYSNRLSREAHPFTISSAPTRPDRLTFTIKASGDWTAGVRNLQPGDLITLGGPFGRFSHLACRPGQPLVLIAAGIGITPMLSMLRYMRATGDERPILLLWSNRTRQDLVRDAELIRLARELTGLTVVHTFTGENNAGHVHGRFDRQNLATLLKAADRRAAVFICGPPRMMAQAARHVRALGFRRSAIHTEPFGF